MTNKKIKKDVRKIPLKGYLVQTKPGCGLRVLILLIIAYLCLSCFRAIENIEKIF